NRLCQLGRASGQVGAIADRLEALVARTQGSLGSRVVPCERLDLAEERPAARVGEGGLADVLVEALGTVDEPPRLVEAPAHRLEAGEMGKHAGLAAEIRVLQERAAAADRRRHRGGT